MLASTTGSSGNAPTPVFKLRNATPSTRAMIRPLIALGAFSSLLCVGLSAVNALDASPGITTAVTLWLTIAWLALLFGFPRRGYVRIDAEGIVVKRKFFRADYPWRDIEDIRVIQQNLTGLAGLIVALTRSADAMPYVELRLSQPVRIGPNPSRASTGGHGLSTGLRRMLLEVEDPQGFLVAAQPLLETFSIAGSSLST